MSSWANFDPSRFIREGNSPPRSTAQLRPVPAKDVIRGTIKGIRERDYCGMPRDWAAGLRRMNTIDAPRGARRDRWPQLVLDAHRFAWGWAGIATERGWSTETVFGFNPNDPYQDAAGLIFSLRGDRVVSLFTDDRGRSVATIFGDTPGESSGYRWFYQRPIKDAELIWAARSIG